MIVINTSALEFVELAGRRSADPLGGRGGQTSVRVVVLDTVQRRPAHRHPHSEEVIYVASGRGAIWIEGAWSRVEEGDMVVVGLGDAHATVPDEDAVLRLICFFPHDDLAQNLEETDTVVDPHERPRGAP